jgi:dihydroneopterin aldolase
MEFRAAHGCYALERKVGGNFEVSVTLTVEGGDAPETDDVTGTVNYVDVYEAVRDEMSIPSAIIENVALRIARAIRARFAQVQRVEVTVSKLAPPLGGKSSKVSVSLSE